MDSLTFGIFVLLRRLFVSEMKKVHGHGSINTLILISIPCLKSTYLKCFAAWICPWMSSLTCASFSVVTMWSTSKVLFLQCDVLTVLRHWASEGDEIASKTSQFGANCQSGYWDEGSHWAWGITRSRSSARRPQTVHPSGCNPRRSTTS